MTTRSRIACRVVICITLIVFALAPALNVHAQWSGWDCKWSITNYPVTGGSLSARGCRQLYSGGQLWWRAWSDTYVPNSYRIYTYVAGWDECTGHPPTFNMDTYNNDYNTTYGTSGIAEGVYQSCSGGHTYIVKTTNLRWQTSSSSAEGTWNQVSW